MVAEKLNKEEEIEESPKEQEPSKKEKKKTAALEEENAKLKAEVEHWKNEYYRAYADTKNLRNSLEKEHKEALKYRSEGFIEELLPILDSFYMALGKEPNDPTLKNYLIGFQFIYKNLINVLENEGVSEISPEIGQEFDPKTMSAVDTVIKEKENIITEVYAKGYKLHDRIIRPANVQVSVLEQKEESKENNQA